MNDNRYAAPVAAVADIDTTPVVERPRNVVIGVSLLWVQLALGIPGMINQLTNPPSEIPEGQVRTVALVTMTVVLAGSLLLFSLINWKCWQGRNWARIVHLVFLCLGLLMVYWALPAVFARSTLQGAVYIVQTVLNIAGVVLLFTPPANTWYQALRAVRR